MSGLRDWVPMPTDDDVHAAADRARGPVHEAWRRSVRRRRIVRSGVALSFALAFGVLLVAWPERRAPEPLATLVESFGEVQTRSGALPSEDDLSPGGLLRTGRESGVRLRLADGTDLRLDSESTLEWLQTPAKSSLDAPSVRLSSGALFYRSPPSPGHALAVATPFGDLINRGTEYELRLVPLEGMRVMVAEGSVRVRTARSEEILVHAGEGLLVSPDGETATAGAEATPREWTGKLSRPFTIDGRTIDDFVRWVAEERGLEVRWMVGEEARGTRLRGELIWRDPEAALAPTLRMAGLGARIEERLLFVEMPSERLNR